MNYLSAAPDLSRLPHDVGLDPDDPASAFELLLQGCREGLDGALLTIVKIEGGAPRSLGTHMAVLSDGRYCGYVSGGCVESAVASEAIAVMAGGRDKVLRFGRNSPFFDITLPCGGGIDVHVHVRPAIDLLEAAAANVRARRPFDIVFDIDAGIVMPVASGATPSAGFLRRYRPATRLLAIGQGNELAVLAQVARGAGIETTAFATGPGALAAAARVGTKVEDVPDGNLDVVIDRWTAVVFLFHEHRSEVPLLATALRSDGFYIGALGSRRTHAERVARLSAAGLAPEQIARIHAPIGMIERTREGTPLAFSILADITRERMQMDAAEVSA